MIGLSDLRERRLGIGELIISGWQFFTDHAAPLILITLVVYVPVNTILSFVPGNGLQIFRMMQFLESFIGVIATIAIARLIERILHGETMSAGHALQDACGRWTSALRAKFLSGFIIVGLLFCLIVPAIIWLGYYIFVDYVVALRDVGGKRALDYSKSLVKGQWWRIVGMSFGLGLIGCLPAMIVGMCSSFLPDTQWVHVVSNTIIDVVTAPLTVMFTFFFLNIDALHHGTGSVLGAETPTS